MRGLIIEALLTLMVGVSLLRFFVGGSDMLGLLAGSDVLGLCLYKKKTKSEFWRARTFGCLLSSICSCILGSGACV